MTTQSPTHLLLGQLRRDFLITPSGKMLIDQPGGNLLYAAGGASLWMEEDQTLGLVARVGEDYPRTWLDDLKRVDVGYARPRSYTVTCKDGSKKEIFFRPVTMQNHDQFVIYEDITEKSKLEQQLHQALKFEAIGTLAGGIAHDFNNLLMGMQGRASLMRMDLDNAHPHVEHLKAIEEHIRSSADLTRQLLGFARGGKYEVKPIDLNDVVIQSAAMFARTRKEIDIQRKIHPSPVVVEADRSQIEQVLLNIYVNAWQAMPDGGQMVLETRTTVLDDDECRTYQI